MEKTPDIYGYFIQTNRWSNYPDSMIYTLTLMINTQKKQQQQKIIIIIIKRCHTNSDVYGDNE